MDFVLNNVNQAPVLEPSGAINLQDWRAAGSLQATPHYPIKLPSGQILELSEQPEPPTKQLLAVNDEDLTWIAQQGNFPIVNALAFVRGLTADVGFVAPMLSFGSFFAEYSTAIKKIVETNVKNKAKGGEWVEYYASALADYPIFNTVFNLLIEKQRAAIGWSYFEQFTDIKFLTPTQLNALTLEQKVEVLKITLSKYPGNDGKLDVAIALFGADETIPVGDAATILGYTRGSTDAGRLMVCNGFINDYTNSHNVVATWIHHCIREKIGTNQSVWFKAATDLEVKHNFALAGEYIKNLQGQPIGLNYNASTLGGVSGGYRSTYTNNQPMGL